MNGQLNRFAIGAYCCGPEEDYSEVRLPAIPYAFDNLSVKCH